MNNIRENVNLVKAELDKQLSMLYNYPLELIGNTITFVLVIILVLFGIDKFGSKSQMFGLIYMPFIMTLIGTPTETIRSDIQIGVFEQVYNSNYFLHNIMIIRSLVNIIFILPVSIIILLTITLIYNVTISISTVALGFVLALISSLSLGMIFGALTMVYKKLDSIMNLVNIIIMFTVALPVFSFHEIIQKIFILLVPLGGVIGLVQSSLSSNLSDNVSILALAICNMIIWFIISRFFYNHFYIISREKGTLGHY